MRTVKLTDLPEKFTAVIAHLKEGNRRFAENSPAEKDFPAQRKSLVGGQQPETIVLACSDSRMVPEYTFDEDIGSLFVIRDAGNIFGPLTLGSIEYAAGNLGSKVFLVLGHTNCGAVIAALDGAGDTPFIKKIAEELEPAVSIAKSRNLPREDTINEAIYENVRMQMKKSAETSELLRGCVEKGSLAIIGGIYDLESGKVEFLDKAIIA
jgi:carbonic anhydrase